MVHEIDPFDGAILIDKPLDIETAAILRRLIEKAGLQADA